MIVCQPRHDSTMLLAQTKKVPAPNETSLISTRSKPFSNSAEREATSRGTYSGLQAKMRRFMPKEQGEKKGNEEGRKKGKKEGREERKKKRRRKKSEKYWGPRRNGWAGAISGGQGQYLVGRGSIGQAGAVLTVPLPKIRFLAHRKISLRCFFGWLGQKN